MTSLPVSPLDRGGVSRSTFDRISTTVPTSFDVTRWLVIKGVSSGVLESLSVLFFSDTRQPHDFVSGPFGGLLLTFSRSPVNTGLGQLVRSPSITSIMRQLKSSSTSIPVGR
jgi:hypothetical protein